MKIKSVFHRLNLKLLLLSVFISLGLALFGYLLFFQSRLLSRREYFYTLLLWISLTPLLYLLLTRFLLPRLHEYTPRAQRNWLLLSIGVGILFALVTRPPQLILLLPKHTLQVLIPAGAADRSVTLEYATTARQDIGFGEFTTRGDWKRTDTGFTHSGSDPASLFWSGRTGDSAMLVFSDTPAASEILVGWDEITVPLDSSQATSGQILFSFPFSTPWLSSGAARVLVGLTATFLFLVISLFFAGIQIKPGDPVKHKKAYWLLYTLPMIVIWGVYLLTFWPGMMSNDSSNQWNQIVTGLLFDTHPIFHTLSMWLITRLWFSPAAVAIVQILALSLTVAWGISILDDQGFPTWGAWSLTTLIALSPVNGDMVINLWKDVFYSTSLLLLSVMILKIVFTLGGWFASKTSWVWLSLVSVCVASFRHNGLPVPILTFPILILVYKKWWKPLVSALVLFFVLWVVFQGPVYKYLKVNHNYGALIKILNHHIAAHISTGNPLTSSELEIAQDFIKLDQLQYSCCSHYDSAPAFFRKSNNPKLLLETGNLYLELAQKEPLVEIQHQVCVSSLVWEIPVRCRDLSFLPYSYNNWISTKYVLVDQNSQLPSLLPLLTSFLLNTKSDPIFMIIYTPSVYLYLGILCTLFISFRRNNFHLLLYLLPVEIQSLILIIINFNSEYRFQSGVILISLFSLGLFLLGLCTPKNVQPGLDSTTPSPE